MWTRENRGLYVRRGARYPSDLSDTEWALIVPLIPPDKRGRRRREVMNGVFYVLGTGCQWRRLLRQNWLSNRIFTSHDDILDHCC